MTWSESIGWKRKSRSLWAKQNWLSVISVSTFTESDPTADRPSWSTQ